MRSWELKLEIPVNGMDSYHNDNILHWSIVSYSILYYVSHMFRLLMVSITTIPLYHIISHSPNIYIYIYEYSLKKGLKMNNSTACRSLELPAVLLRTLRTGQRCAARAAGAPLGVGSSVDVISCDLGGAVAATFFRMIHLWLPSGNLTWLLKMAIYSGFSH